MLGNRLPLAGPAVERTSALMVGTTVARGEVAVAWATERMEASMVVMVVLDMVAGVRKLFSRAGLLWARSRGGES